MPYSIFITPTAIDDIAVAIEYYNALSLDLGYRFSDLVAEYFDRIAAMPTASAIRYKNVRCKPIKRFPYLITYSIDETMQSINILRVFNTYQEPLG
jgi:toxin ParE1/3/4